MKVLVLYDQYSTFTNTVLDHLRAFGAYSRHEHYYCHAADPRARINWEAFDVVMIHYCLRVAFGQLPEVLSKSLSGFQGVKVLFVQDEYDLTETTRRAIEQLGINVVFTCVPDAYREHIYPSARFPVTRFVNTLTGYVPLNTSAEADIPPIRNRPLVIAYRGRALPFYYGDLGQEKLVIAKRMRAACEERQLACDIEWDNAHRIYGDAWPKFLKSAKATLGTESGSNLFDDDGSLRAKVKAFQDSHPDSDYAETRNALFGTQPELPIMNQISPRFFEAINFKTAMVLFEGAYSGVLRPWEHYLPLRKDFANLDDIFRHLADDDFLQAMVDRAYGDVISSGRYTYAQFVQGYDAELSRAAGRSLSVKANVPLGADVTPNPIRSNPVPPPPAWMSALWNAIPTSLRKHLHHQVVRLWMTLREPK